MTVVHCKQTPHTHYIGRPSLLGNPFQIGPAGTREDVIAKFEMHARSHPEVMSVISRLPADAVLGCWCAPRPCHGDVIMKLWKELHEQS